MSSISGYFLTPAHHKAIGYVTSEWSYVESILEKLIWQIAGLDEKIGSCFTANAKSETMINLLYSLADQRPLVPKLEKELKSLVEDLRNLRKQRNSIVHAVWSRPEPITQLPKSGRKRKPYAIDITAKGSLQFTKVPYSAKQITNIGVKITTLISRMVSLLHMIRESEQKHQASAKVLTQDQTHTRDPDPKTKGLLEPRKTARKK